MRTLLVCAIAFAGCGNVKDNDVDAPVGNPDMAVTACPVGTTAVCANDTALTCDAQGNMLTTEACSLGCNATEPRCNKLAPSNNLAMAFDEATQAPDLILMGNATIDTDAGTIVDQSGPRTPPTSTLTTGLPIGVFVIKANNVTANAITVNGTKALAIVAGGTITIKNTLQMSAKRDVSGPGSLDNACRAGSAAAGNNMGGGGGGGGGFGTAGGRGGTGGSPQTAAGIAGAVAGNVELVPLRGGCPGGNAFNRMLDSDPVASDPGGGGGAVQLVAGTEIVVKAGAFISANGAGGKGNNNQIFCIVNTPCGDGEGGGSGGGILLESPKITIEMGAGLAANGGGGSCLLTGDAPGGGNTATPALGQTCSGDTGDGGAGAAGTTAALNGANGTGNNPVGGGGGGGAGRIRVNLPLSQTFMPAGTVSPASTRGVLGVR